MDRMLGVRSNIDKIYFDTPLFLPNEFLQLFVEEQSRMKNVDPVSFLSHLLPTVGHCMSGLKTQVVFHKDWKEPTILYHILVAPKSTSKTPVMNVIITEINKIEKEERERAQTEHELMDEENESGSTFNPLAHVRVFSTATSQGLLHALNAGNGNVLGMIDELSGWVGFTNAELSTDLLSAYNSMPFGNLTVAHRNVKVDKPYINLSGNIQTRLLHESLQKEDPQAKYCRYSMFAVREKHCKRFSLVDQLKPMDEKLKDFSLKKIFERIIQFHEEKKVEYHFSTASHKTAMKFVSSLNAMSAASDCEDFQSMCTKSVSKFLRVCGVQTALRNSMEDDEEEIEDRRSTVKVIMDNEDVLRAMRCTLYQLASYRALRDSPEKENTEFEEAPENETLLDEQPSLPKARKYRRKSGDLPDVETSSIKDLTDPKIGKHLAKWTSEVDENDKVSVNVIRHNRWFVRSKNSQDEEMLIKLIELAEFHGVVERSENEIKILRSSSSSVIQSKIDILMNDIPGYMQ